MDDSAGEVPLRAVIREVCGFDPGELGPHDRLSSIGLEGLDLMGLIAAIEARYGIEFPADLLPAMETVDDLLYFTAVKRSQQ